MGTDGSRLTEGWKRILAYRVWSLSAYASYKEANGSAAQIREWEYTVSGRRL